MHNAATYFTEIFHQGVVDNVTPEQAKAFEDRFCVNLWSSKAADPAAEWKCTTLESVHDCMRWFYITTADYAVHVIASLADDLPSGEVVFMPRRLSKDGLKKFATSKSREYPDHDISKFADYENFMLEMVSHGPTCAIWQYLVPNTEIQLELKVTWDEGFGQPNFDLQVYGAPDEVDLLPEMAPKGDVPRFLKFVVQLGPEEPPFGYRVFNYQGDHYIMVQFGKDNYIVFTRGFLRGLQEIPYGSDAFDEIEHIYDALMERPMIPFPILR
jgi:hypothetical protein